MIKTTGQVQIARNSLNQISDGVYRFSITMSGFIVNGFVYNQRTGQIRMPSCNYGSGSKKLVRAYGIHVKRLRERIEQELENVN